MRPLPTACLLLLGSVCLNAYEAPPPPYAPAAGLEGTTALAHDDARFLSWAVRVAHVAFGEDVDDSTTWRDPAAALGPAGAGTPDVLVLGRGGSVVLEFDQPISDGDGDDFAVFENAFSDSFLELAYVEVSSDGVHFVRFPNYSLTPDPVGTWGIVSARSVHGLAGKYRAGYGTPFDLSVLAEAHDAALAQGGGFSPEFRDSLLENFPMLDIQSVRYVRLLDIPGDGTSKDCEGFAIYDPYPTFITGGFDLDAVGVLNMADIQLVGFAEWSRAHNLEAQRDADTDGDRWPQYLEYLMGSNPTDQADRPFTTLTADKSGILQFTYRTSRSAVGDPVIQASADGSQWTAVDPEEAGLTRTHRVMEVTLAPADDGGPMQLVRIIAGEH